MYRYACCRSVPVFVEALAATPTSLQSGTTFAASTQQHQQWKLLCSVLAPSAVVVGVALSGSRGKQVAG